ncbi:MAG: hypothetical protein EXR75_04635 [Myxococcales bacterium]|nr:hypothetical protein [Myxococcales bacterium]
MRTVLRGLCAATVSLAVLSCGSAPGEVRAPPAARAAESAAVSLRAANATTRPPASAAASAVEPSTRRTSQPGAAAETEALGSIVEILATVSARRELPDKFPVIGSEISREEGIRRIIEKTKADVPERVFVAQGEFFAALGLTPPDYPFVEGLFALIEKNIAGFYDPDADRMFLLDDLDPSARRETLAHELVHALQDQHYELGARLTYQPGHIDRLAATSCLAEGDATSLMLDISLGSAFNVEADQLRLALMASMALSETGRTTPRALQLSLVSPYIDGFRFVQTLRERGGWAAVDSAWQAPPQSTEQVLHIDKYDAREPALEVAEPTSSALGEGWARLDGDSAGEQGLRIALEQWLIVRDASIAAAGWGGDRYVVFQRKAEAGSEFAIAWRVRFDDAKEAGEAASLLKKHVAACVERPGLGPLAWHRDGDTLALVAGPYRRVAGKATASPGASCTQAKRWLATMTTS